jgi:hypothetical protein
MKEGELETGLRGGDRRSGKRVAFKISAKIIELIEMQPKRCTSKHRWAPTSDIMNVKPLSEKI